MKIFTNKRQFQRLFLFFILTAIAVTQTYATGTWVVGPEFFHQRSGNTIKYIDAQTNVVAGGLQLTNAIIRHGDRGREVTNYRDFDSISTQNSTQVQFNDLSVPAHNIAYVVGWAGAILKSNNVDGDYDFHYLTRYLPTSVNTRDFNGVHFIDNNQGIVVGGVRDATQTILRTTDGGYNWTVVSDVAGSWLTSVTFINNNTGYAVGDNGTVLKTTNSGVSWTTVTIPSAVESRDFNRIRFINATTGFIVGGDLWNSYQTILRTTDGGSTWTVIVDNASSSMLNGIGFLDATRGFTVGYNGIILATTDAGITWNPYSIGAVDQNIALKDVNFYNEKTGAIVGEWGKYYIYLDSIPPLPSVITGNVVVDTMNASAILSGQINANNGSAQGIFEYGTTIALGSQINATPSPITGSTFQTVNATISNLTPGLYYYRLRATSVGGDSVGVIRQFSIGIPTAITGNVIIDIANNSVVLAGQINANGSSAQGVFEYGTTMALGSQINATPSPITGSTFQTVNATISNLTPGIYYYRIKATNTGGQSIGDISQFSIGIPTATTGLAIIDPELKAQLNGTVNAKNFETTVYFEYGTSASLGTTVNITNNPITGYTDQAVSVVTPPLAEGVYFFRVVATNASGTIYGAIQQFFVGENPIPNFDFEHWTRDTFRTIKEWITISVSQVPSYDGSNAAQIDATQSGEMGSGILLMGSFGDGGPAGGTPFTERADSVVFYANYSTSQTVSALFGVLFKKGGEFISMNPFFLGGTTTDYTTNGQFVRFAFPISFPDATIVPDSVIILSSSGNMFTQQFDPNNVLIIDNISFVGTSQNVPNSNFEEMDELYAETLVSWSTPDNGSPYPPFRVTRTTDAQHGEYAVRLENLPNNGQFFMEVERENPENWNRPTFAVNNKYTTLNGYYKYDQGGGTDTAIISITMYKNGNQIGSGYYYFSENVSEYTYFSDSIIYYMNEIPDSASIRVDGIKDWNSGVTGNSVLFLDNLTFDVLRTEDTLTVTSIKENKINSIANIKIYPNPTSNYIAFKLSSTEEIEDVNIYDLQGRTFSAENITNGFSDVKMYNVSNYPSGWYILTVKTNKQTYSGRFIVNK
jgi:photosystem II stability/assembly factor-like uncharacterized protein